MTMGSALAKMLQATTDAERKAAAKEMVEGQEQFQREAASMGIQVTFKETDGALPKKHRPAPPQNPEEQR